MKTTRFPVRMCVYATASPSLFGKGIRYYSRPVWWQVWRLAKYQHVGNGFEFADGSRERHEALLSEGWSMKESWDALETFGRTKGNRVRIWWLPIYGCELASLYFQSMQWIGEKRSYAIDQIVRLAIGNSIAGRALRSILGVELRADTDRVVCHEGVARLLYMNAGARWDMRPRAPEGSFDGLSPEYVAHWLDAKAETECIVIDNIEGRRK